MAGTIERNIGNLHDQDTGTLKGYRNPVTGKEEALDAPALQSLVSEYGGPLARPGDMLRKISTVMADTTLTTGAGSILLTNATRTLSDDYSRFGRHGLTHKCVLSTTTAQVKFHQMPRFYPDADLEFAIDIYLPQNPDTYAASKPNITLSLNNNDTSSVSNSTRRTYTSTYLKQGWNTLRVRAADTNSTTDGAGNLPTGVNRPADTGTFTTLADGIRQFHLDFTNMDGWTVYIDVPRIPARARTMLTIGWDALGKTISDTTLEDRAAPLLAEIGAAGYFTYSQRYDGADMDPSNVYQGQRARLLYEQYGWDAVNHTWSHGATTAGRRNSATLALASDVVTVTLSTAMDSPVGSTIRAKISGVTSPASLNGVFTMVVATSTTLTYTVGGAGTGAVSGSPFFATFLSEVLDSNTDANKRTLRRELGDTRRHMISHGMGRGRATVAFPNNSGPELTLLETICAENDIKWCRGYRGGYASVSEFGVVNPLLAGSFEMGSGSAAAYSTFSVLQAKILGAVARGEHIHLFGHYLVDDTDPANAAYAPLPVNGYEHPPGANGNPSPPASEESVDGYWYVSTLQHLVRDVIAPLVRSGDLAVVTPSQYVTRLGL